jgi:steroid 5-alpha reductase family enzyme
MKEKHFIDSHKFVTFLFVLGVMAAYGRWDNLTLWVYLALHGSYGLLWVLKSQVFPDKQWEKPASLVRGLILWAGLSLYWIAPVIIAAGDVQAPAWLLALAIALNVVGTFFHFASDMQKHIELKRNPGHLITDGFWRLSRSPNYFGEFLIYSSFALLALHWLPWVAFAVLIVGAWIPYMRAKERSLARYPEFAAYKARTRMFIPFVF